MSSWFRLYGELLDNPKVQRLPGEDFKAWINILCLASRKDGSLPDEADIAFALRLDMKRATAIIGRLVSGGLLERVEGGFVPHKWNDRQYKSDVSTGRVKRFRERSKKRDEAATETAPDTDTDTDTDTSVSNETAQPDSDKQFWDGAKAYLGPQRASMIGKWVKAHGKAETASAITAAQLERAINPIEFIQGRFRQQKTNGYGAGHSGVPL